MFLTVMGACAAYVALMVLGLTWAGIQAGWRALFGRKVSPAETVWEWERVQRIEYRFWPAGRGGPI